MHFEMERQVTCFCKVAHDTCGINRQELIVCIDMDPSEGHLMGRAIHADPQIQRNGEATQCRRERFGDVFQHDASRDAISPII